MSAMDTFEHAGLTVKIHADEDPEHANPREDDGNLGVMFCDYRGYNLGDKDAPDPRGHMVDCDCDDGEVPLLSEELGDLSGTMECPKCHGLGEVELSVVEYLKREHGATVILPLFVYEHSGITTFCGGRLDKGEDNFDRRNRFPFDSAGWDTSSVGVVFDTAETRKYHNSKSEDDIENRLREEVKFYAAYLEGMVFGFVIEDEDGEVLDSCWGFLDPDAWSPEKSYVHQAAREAAEEQAELIQQEAAEAERWACADVITVRGRR